jgi:N-acetylglucosamine kinase-like BadF-type ATPase
VQRAADAGDATASEIIDRAARELATSAGSVITRLGMRGDPFPTVLSGGVFRGIPSLAGKVARQVAEIAPRSEVRPLDVEPAVGAVRLALAAARGPVAIPSYV